MSYIFNDDRWKYGTNIFQKEKIISTLFHSKMWRKLNPKNRIFILQEIENIQAEKQKRNPYKIVLLNENYNLDRDLFDMMVNYNTKKIYMRCDYVEKGLKQNITYEGIRKIDINDRLNVELLDGIIHEGYHIWTMQKAIKTKNMGNLKLEDREVILGLLIRRNIGEKRNTENNVQIMENERYLYRVEPAEYYAFKYAKDYIDKLFEVLERKYEKDEGYQNYLKYYYQEICDIEKKYNEDKNESLCYQEIYKKVFFEYIEKFIDKDRRKAEKVLDILKINKRNYQIDNSRELE